MPGLSFAVEGAEAVPFAAVPTLAFPLRITNACEDEAIQSIALRCQILIEAARRRYNQEERTRLRDLFGEPDRWSQTLRPMLWTHANLTVPGFRNALVTQLQIPCTFDFNVAAAKYFHGVSQGEVPLTFQYSGTVFYAAAEGRLQTEQIAWNQESRFGLPAAIWKQMMDLYYPNSAWLRLQRDVFDRLSQYKTSRGLATFEEAIAELLPGAERAS
jgi:hypothetical protein